jgi:hypothetical protein
MSKNWALVLWGGVLCLAGAADARAQGAAKQTFAKDAMPVELACGDANPAPRELRWGDATLTLTCNGSGANAPIQGRYKLGIVEATVDLTTEDPAWRPAEVLWFGSGRTFLVNGGTSATAGQTFIVFRTEAGELKRGDVTGPARKAMHDKLAKCWSQMKKAPVFNDPGYTAFNLLGLAWLDEGRAVTVFAKVVADSKYGEATGETLGFELDSRSGTVLRTMTAADFKERWQPAAAWPIRVPEPVKCGKLFPTVGD